MEPSSIIHSQAKIMKKLDVVEPKNDSIIVF